MFRTAMFVFKKIPEWMASLTSSRHILSRCGAALLISRTVPAKATQGPRKIFKVLLDKLSPSCYSNKGRTTQGISSLGGSILHFNNWIAEGRFKELSQFSIYSESLILAQDKRWRRASCMQVERFNVS